MERIDIDFENLKINQLGYVYKDVEKQAKIMEEVFGMGQFAILENRNNTCKYRGKESTFSTKIAISRSFNTQIELIQLIEGECIFKEFLDAGLEGLHHFGIFVTDLDAYVAKFQKKGFEVVHAAQTGAQNFAYIDTIEAFGIFL